MGDEAGRPRWRSTEFVAVDGNKTVFKATDCTVDSLFLDRGAGSIFQTLLNTTMLASDLNLGAPLGSFISSPGIERDGFGGGRIAINAGFLNAASLTCAGIYTTEVAPIPLPLVLPMLLGALGMPGFVRRRR